MRRVLAILGSVGFVAASAQAAAVEMRADTAGGALGITEATGSSIAGVYERAGRGLRFSASHADETVALLLQTLDGRELLRITDRGPGAEVLVFGEYRETEDKASLARRRQAFAQAQRGVVAAQDLPPLQVRHQGGATSGSRWRRSPCPFAFEQGLGGMAVLPRERRPVPAQQLPTQR